MKTTLVCALAATLTLSALSQVAQAQTQPAAAPAAATPAAAEPASPLSFNIGLTTDYRYRGISQSRLQPAIQGGLDYVTAPSQFSGGSFYIGAWVSTIKWIKDAGEITGVNTGSSNFEVDLYGGFKGEIQKDLSYDFGILQYLYPGNNLKAIDGLTSANTTELYGALTFGPATVKYSHALTNLFGTGNSKQSGYLEAGASVDVGSGVMLAPHVGYQRVANSGDFSYFDYSLGVSKDVEGFLFSGSIVGARTKKINDTPAYVSPSGKNLGRAGLVVSVKKTF
jgi:uncharacterized protein (TIGR02001 family)